MQASSCPRGPLLIRNLHSQWITSFPPEWVVYGPSGSHAEGGQGDEEGAPRQAEPRSESLPHHALAGLHTSMPDTPTCVQTCAHGHLCMHVHTRVCQLTRTDMLTRAHVYASMCTHAHAHELECVHTCTYTYAQYTRTHMRGYIFLTVWTSPVGDQAGTQLSWRPQNCLPQDPSESIGEDEKQEENLGPLCLFFVAADSVFNRYCEGSLVQRTRMGGG